MAHKSEHLNLNGARIHLRRAGSGTPLLFLHGAGGVTSWLPCFDELAKDQTLLVPDHRGFGESDTPAWLFGMGDFAYCYLDFIKHLGLQDLDVVGHSMGGRQREAKTRAAMGRFIVGSDAATMRFDDGARNGQAQSHAGVLSREKAVEEMIEMVRIDAGPAVLERAA